MLYAYTSASENNGSAFAGITVNTPWYDLTLASACSSGGFVHHSCAGDCRQPGQQEGRPDVGRHTAHARRALCRPARGDRDRGRRADVLPALALGPIVEHFLMHQGKLFSTLFVSPFDFAQASRAPVERCSELELIDGHHNRRVCSSDSYRADAPGRHGADSEETRPGAAALRPGDPRSGVEDSVVKLNPITLMKNPVLVVEVAPLWSLVPRARRRDGCDRISFELQIDIWLWFTVLFATFAEPWPRPVEAQAEALRKTRSDTIANRLIEGGRIEKSPPRSCGRRRRRLQRGRGDSGDGKSSTDRDGRRVGDYRRERAGDPRVGGTAVRSRAGRASSPITSRSRSPRIQAKRSWIE